MAEELKKTLLSIRSLRILTRELTIEQLEEALEKLHIIVDEAKKQKMARIAEEREKEEKIAKIANKITREGIDVYALVTALSNQKPVKRAPRPPKFKYIDQKGEPKTWTGQGRTPKALQEQLDKGRAIEEFLI